MTADTLKLIDSILEWWEDNKDLPRGVAGGFIEFYSTEPDFVTQAKKLKESINPNDLPL